MNATLATYRPPDRAHRITFQRTYDLHFVASILKHPRVYPNIGDDYAGPREGFVPNSDSRIWWVEASEDSGQWPVASVQLKDSQRGGGCGVNWPLDTEHWPLGFLGLFMFLPRSTVLWEMHVSLLPGAWGPPGLRAGCQVIPWVFEHTTCRRLIGEVPRSNTLAIRWAEAIGFARYGVNRRAFMKGGELQDLILLGVSKEAGVP